MNWQAKVRYLGWGCLALGWTVTAQADTLDNQLTAMEKAAQRFNLDGSPGGEVPEEHRKHATEVLRERFKKEVARRKAQREAEEREKQRSEKLNQLVQKFGKNK